MALYVAPGAFERRGLVTGASSYEVEAPRRAETQYLVATPGGTARLIWAETNGAPGGGAFAVFNREARLTMNVTDLLQSTSAVIDLFDGDVLERGTYLPSGVRETRTLDEAQEAFPLEPLGFTGKEDDLEVGLMYFGHRYLMPHLGRWASPDPLQIHSGGGGEFGNSYHYVSGNLLQARDPDGLGPLDDLQHEIRQAVGEAAETASDFAQRALQDFVEEADFFEENRYRVEGNLLETRAPWGSVTVRLGVRGGINRGPNNAFARAEIVMHVTYTSAPIPALGGARVRVSLAGRVTVTRRWELMCSGDHWNCLQPFDEIGGRLRFSGGVRVGTDSPRQREEEEDVGAQPPEDDPGPYLYAEAALYGQLEISSQRSLRVSAGVRAEAGMFMRLPRGLSINYSLAAEYPLYDSDDE